MEGLDNQTTITIGKLAQQTGRSEQEIFAELVKEGLKTYQVKPSGSIKAALDLIAWAEQENITGTVNDISTKHTTYAWKE